MDRFIPKPRARSPRSRLALLALLFTTAGCGRACANDHPYVPYSVDGEAADSGAESSDAASSLDDAGPSSTTSAEPALVAPAGATTWSADGVDLVAPPERELLFAIVRDFDRDGKKDALAVVRPPAPPGKAYAAGAPEVVFYAGSAPGRPPTLVTTAPAPRTDSTCAPVARLERIGAHSALAELGSACSRGTSSRSLFVVRLAKQPAVAFGLSVLDPPGAPKLSIDVDGADRDHDGIDDIALHVTIEGGSPPFEPGPKLGAKVAFFDRSAGASRDPDEPTASLKIIAQRAAARASKSRDAATVPVLVEQMRMLYRAMCSEGGAPRLVKVHGAGGAISCGQSKPLEDAGVAEVRAFVALGDALRAVAAASAAQVAPATKTASRTAEIAKLLAEVAPFVDAKSSRTLAVTVPPSRSAYPEWGSIAFEPSGKLLVRGATQVLRVDPESGESADAGLPPWPSQVLSPDGRSRWLEAYHACEGVGLRATFVPTGTDSEMREVLLPIAPPLGSRCAGGRGEAARATPIAWTERGLEALVAGQPILMRPDSSMATIMASLLDEMPPFGSPRSPGARAMAIATAQGVVVKTTKFVRYRAPELDPPTALSQCTTTDDGSRVACVKNQHVVIATFDPLLL